MRKRGFLDFMKPRCDQGVIESGHAANPCTRRAEPWILAAAILGSSMAFIDSAVVNAAGGISVQAIAGRIRMHLQEEPIHLRVGHVLALERAFPHDVEALEDSAVAEIS
jgi:hypothetical protein